MTISTESLTYDMNEDGRWEIWLADNNQRVGFDVVYFDDNADGYYDRWTPMPSGRRWGPFDVACRGAGAGLVRRHDPPERRDGPGHDAGRLLAGTVAWAPADYDNDGCPDGQDTNNYRNGCSSPTPSAHLDRRGPRSGGALVLRSTCR